MGDNLIEVITVGDDIAAITSLLTLAVGVGQGRLEQAVQRYRDDPASVLLAAVVDHDLVGVVGYAVSESEGTLLHLATAPHAQSPPCRTRFGELCRGVD